MIDLEKLKISAYPDDTWGNEPLRESLLKILRNFEKLSANVNLRVTGTLTLWVSADTSVANGTGLSASSPLSTVQAAIDLSREYNPKTVEIILLGQNSIYSESVTISELHSLRGEVTYIIRGESATKQAEWLITDSLPIAITAAKGVSLKLRWVKFTSAITESYTQNATYLHITQGSTLHLGEITFGGISSSALSSHILLSENSVSYLSGNYAITGGARYHIKSSLSSISKLPGLNTLITISLTNIPSFISFFEATRSSTITIPDSNSVLWNGHALGFIYSKDHTSTVSVYSAPLDLSPGETYPVSFTSAYTSSPSSNSNDNSIPTTHWVQDLLTEKIAYLESLISQITGEVSGLPIFPIGSVIAIASNSIPSGWLLCDGSEVSRTTYANLFSAIGISWGAGNGSTTFNLPDFRGRALIGSNPSVGGVPSFTVSQVGQYLGRELLRLSVANLPPHTHEVNSSGHTHAIDDRGHIHSITDRPHSHTLFADGNNGNASLSWGGVGTNTTTLSSNTAYTGITETQSAHSNLSLARASDSITISNVGGGTPISLMQPSASLKFCIRY